MNFNTEIIIYIPMKSMKSLRHMKNLKPFKKSLVRMSKSQISSR